MMPQHPSGPTKHLNYNNDTYQQRAASAATTTTVVSSSKTPEPVLVPPTPGRSTREQYQIRDSLDQEQYSSSTSSSTYAHGNGTISYDRYDPSQRRFGDTGERLQRNDGPDKHHLSSKGPSYSYTNDIDNNKNQFRQYDTTRSSVASKPVMSNMSYSAAVYPSRQELLEQQFRSGDFHQSGTDYAVTMPRNDVGTVIGTTTVRSDYIGDSRNSGTEMKDDIQGRDHYQNSSYERSKTFEGDRSSEYVDGGKYSSTSNRMVGHSDQFDRSYNDHPSAVRMDVDDSALLMDRNSQGSRRSNEYGRLRHGNMDKDSFTGSRLNDVTYGRNDVGRGTEVADVGRRNSFGRETPPMSAFSSMSESLSITNPNPLKRRSEQSLVHEYEGNSNHMNVYSDTARSTVDPISSGNSSSYPLHTSYPSKSPREMYNGPSHRIWNRPESSVDNNYNNKKAFPQQSQQKSRSERIHTAYEDHRGMINDSNTRNKLRTDPSETANVRTKEEPISPRIPPKLSESDRTSTDSELAPEIITVNDKDDDLLPTATAIEVVEPSGYVRSLLRLADLEAQMEYEYVKLQQLMFQQQILRLEYNVLEQMPIGVGLLLNQNQQISK